MYEPPRITVMRMSEESDVEKLFMMVHAVPVNEINTIICRAVKMDPRKTMVMLDKLLAEKGIM